MAFTYILVGSALLIIVLVIYVFKLKNQAKILERLVKHTNEKLERLQMHFGRFTPEEVIEHMAESDGTYTARMCMVTVLFADLKGFTKMCEAMDPQNVVDILNGYFRVMSEQITLHHGQVTEFLGDGILAMFGALRPNPWQRQDAVLSGVAMRKALIKYNQELRLKSMPELAFGIGIHQGEVLAGVMGNFELSKFGVVGDTINVAARVEALTRILQCDLLITREVQEGLDQRFVLEEMPAQDIKGKEEPLVTYFVKSLKDTY